MENDWYSPVFIVGDKVTSPFCPERLGIVLKVTPMETAILVEWIQTKEISWYWSEDGDIIPLTVYL